VSYGRKKFEKLVISDSTENKMKGLNNSFDARNMHIQGIITPPNRPIPFAIPTPVVLILVG
jgi:hypothetical protein